MGIQVLDGLNDAGTQIGNADGPAHLVTRQPPVTAHEVPQALMAEGFRTRPSFGLGGLSKKRSLFRSRDRSWSNRVLDQVSSSVCGHPRPPEPAYHYQCQWALRSCASWTKSWNVSMHRTVCWGQ